MLRVNGVCEHVHSCDGDVEDAVGWAVTMTYVYSISFVLVLSRRLVNTALVNHERSSCEINIASCVYPCLSLTDKCTF